MVAGINKTFVNSVPGFAVVDTAGTAAEGIAKTTVQMPDLALIDVYLPDQDGLSLLQELRRINIPTDAILLTAAHDTETIERAFRYGAVDYILKPFKFQRLKIALESYNMMRMKLDSMDSLSQQEIDHLKNSRRLTMGEEEGMADIPKGLNDLTMKQVLLFMLKTPYAMSAEEVAEGLGLARVTARRYLEYLDIIGRVSVDLQYGSVGRPIKKYKIS
ncbi:MAG: chemotaxis protein CheY [Peptococcaceae bacterium BRH_c4a]|nr:MAG: chemotaxis protein CheY [Peptococcaceae bacterium BRH_c4a]